MTDFESFGADDLLELMGGYRYCHWRWAWRWARSIRQANPSISVKNRLILHLDSSKSALFVHGTFFPSREFTILLIEETRRSPVDMVNIIIICRVSYIQTVVVWDFWTINSIHLHSRHFWVNEFLAFPFGGIHVVISKNGRICSLPNPDARCMDYLPTKVEKWPHEQGQM